jgi:type IV pilus assembly protein PilV
MEWLRMALMHRKRKPAARKQRGMTLIELMIAMVVLLVGVVGSMALVALSIGSNGKSRQQSNSTAVAQLLTERISAVQATTNPLVTVTDCTGNVANVSTTGPGGSPLTSSGDVDFTQTAVTNYQMLYTDCSTNGRQIVYDVRWNIQQTTPYIKFLTVSAKMRNAGGDAKYFSLPVTVRTLIGQGT